MPMSDSNCNFLQTKNFPSSPLPLPLANLAEHLDLQLFFFFQKRYPNACYLEMSYFSFIVAWRHFAFFSFFFFSNSLISYCFLCPTLALQSPSKHFSIFYFVLSFRVPVPPSFCFLFFAERISYQILFSRSEKSSRSLQQYILSTGKFCGYKSVRILKGGGGK